MTRARLQITASLGLLLILSQACSDREGGWAPVLEETSTDFLTAEVGQALDRVEAVRSALPQDPETAAAAAAEAEAALRRLSGYYLPVLEARERSYNAYRHHLMGEDERTLGELERVEEILLELGEGQGEFMVHELEHPLELVSDAKLAVAGTSDEADRLLEELSVELHDMLVKGGLIVR